MERTITNNDLLRTFQNYVDKKGFNRIMCLAVIEMEKLEKYYFRTGELTDEEMLRLEDTLLNERKAGEF
ncbi:MAG: hypothetical protein ACERLG_00735 [Sedimentibacter sp.]